MLGARFTGTARIANLPTSHYSLSLPLTVSFYVYESVSPVDSPVVVYLSTGNSLVMLRYLQWLLCTPVRRSAWGLRRGAGRIAQVLLVNVADMLATPTHVLASPPRPRPLPRCCWSTLRICWAAMRTTPTPKST